MALDAAASIDGEFPLQLEGDALRRGGREAEGGGLLNRYTVISRIVGSNPIPSAIPGYRANDFNALDPAIDKLSVMVCPFPDPGRL
jgi:hypothetical protein